jgi:hypothetical protein
MSSSSIERVAYLGQPNCFRLSNGVVDVIVTTDVGPRVVRYGFVGRPNVFGEVPDATIPTELGAWKPFGGHRLWAAPEKMPRTYAPDNGPVEHRVEGERSITLIQPTDLAGVQKEMRVSLDPTNTDVTVHHRITNRLMWSIEMAPWALTVMLNGMSIVPQEPFRPHGETFDTARPLALWHFTNMADPRWAFGEHFIRLRADPDRPLAQKIGVANKQGWCAYYLDGTLFVKRFAYENGAQYPDEGSNNELFTAGSFMELESLGPMQTVGPGEAVEHLERWSLFADVDLGDTEADIQRAIDVAHAAHSYALTRDSK